MRAIACVPGIDCNMIEYTLIYRIQMNTPTSRASWKWLSAAVLAAAPSPTFAQKRTQVAPPPADTEACSPDRLLSYWYMVAQPDGWLASKPDAAAMEAYARALRCADIAPASILRPYAESGT